MASAKVESETFTRVTHSSTKRTATERRDSRRERETRRPAGPLVSDNSEAVLFAAIEEAGITLIPDCAAIRAGKLVEVLPGWAGKGDGGVYAIMPPGRLIPAKTRLFVDEIIKSIKAGWAGSKPVEVRQRSLRPPMFRSWEFSSHPTEIVSMPGFDPESRLM